MQKLIILLSIKRWFSMTAIVGFQQNEKLWLIGDSYVGDSESDQKDLCSTPKVYKLKNIIVGICGNPRHEMLLEELLRKELGKKGFVLSHDWLKFKLPVLFHAKCKKAGAIITDEEGEETIGKSSFLIGFDKVFYYLDCNFSIWATKKTTVGIGIAAPYALGALVAIENNRDKTPEQKLTTALDIAASMSHYVSQPYDIVSI